MPNIIDHIIDTKVGLGKAQIVAYIFICLVDVNDGVQGILSNYPYYDSIIDHTNPKIRMESHRCIIIGNIIFIFCWSSDWRINQWEIF